MGKPKTPTPPDPVATANAQTASNRDTAIANSYLGNVNQNTPYGSVSYDVSGYGPNGIPRWTQTTTESPNQATIRGLGESLDIALGNLGLEQTSKIADILGTPYDPRRFDTNAATGGRLDIAGALGDYNGDVEARTRELATRGLGEMYDRSEESLRSRLANQGINAGTDAFGAELQAFNKGKGDAYANAELLARSQAQADRGQSLSELLTGRQTNLGEAQQQFSYDTLADQQARQTPINEINALRSSQLLSPINPGAPNTANMAGTDIAGITNANYANQLAAYQQRMASQNALLGSLAGLGGAAIGAPWLFGGKG